MGTIVSMIVAGHAVGSITCTQNTTKPVMLGGFMRFVIAIVACRAIDISIGNIDIDRRIMHGSICTVGSIGESHVMLWTKSNDGIIVHAETVFVIVVVVAAAASIIAVVISSRMMHRIVPANVVMMDVIRQLTCWRWRFWIRRRLWPRRIGRHVHCSAVTGSDGMCNHWHRLVDFDTGRIIAESNGNGRNALGTRWHGIHGRGIEAHDGCGNGWSR
mmetsp:Transcript_12629/g.36745  ORF Transcript_12629/g.36745 Transcript_12629/m.36745 type:complete len:216 (+) Transcript_12629:1789-2436(+)